MTFFQKYDVPIRLALWMIALPVAFAFLAGAGAGTMFYWLAALLGTMYAIFGWVSLCLGVILLLITVWRGVRAADIPLPFRQQGA